MTRTPIGLTRTILVALLAILICAPTILHASPYSDAVNALLPDAYYRGDEAAGPPVDTTANGNDLNDFFNNTFGAAGPRPGDGFPGMDAANAAYQFTGPQVARSGEGASQYLPALGQDPRTIIAWVNLDTDRATLGGAHNIWQYGVDFGGPNTFTGWSLFIDSGFDPAVGATGFDAVTLNIQGRQTQALDTPINVGDWNMIAICFEGDGTTPLGAANIYVNGALQTNIVQDTSAVPNTGGTNGPALGFRLGQALGGFGANARIDHVSVHTEKLSGAEISRLYRIATPEPTTAILAGLAALGLLGFSRRRSRT